jgi:serine/threonine-protein phosphatase 2B catalytic subunit
MLRGNHECRHLTKHFTFKLECTFKYGEAIYDACMTSFDSLPIAAVVNKQFFCVHGGISPSLKTPDDVNSFDRFREPPKSGLICDLLWTDPTEDYGTEDHDDEFVHNGARGCSYRYSYQAVCNFISRNHLLSVIRGHEAQDAGFRLYRQAEQSEFPSLITLFSAANYVDVYNNKGAVMKYDGKVMNIRQFNCASHPYFLPKFMNVFDWSLPFVGEKIADLLMAVLNVPSLNMKLATLSDDQRSQLEKEKKVKMDVIKSKIRAIGRVNKMFATVRDERETLTELMNVMGTTIVPASYLTLGHEDLRKAIRSFEQARKSDSINEMFPPDDDTGSVVSLALSDSSSTKMDLDQHNAPRVESPTPQIQGRE